ncbi:hypothetical protein ANN_17160 [Periplaneta americana]|uniref:Uncharacterized protein n=1 Tax=Periplaneta americana TaxID=6978 RepID=A0ABQ8STK4_PERAM|nr:hypothetical protein ANN_17160 [Periplaneta americana]
MDTSMLRRSHSVEEEAELQKDSDSDDGILSKIISSTEKVRDLKLKDLPLVHQTKKKSENSSNSTDDDSWMIGGLLGSRNTVLRFRCSALSDPPMDPPANELHMTYKTIQAETKLLSAVLHSHGMREDDPFRHYNFMTNNMIEINVVSFDWVYDYDVNMTLNCTAHVRDVEGNL